MPQIEAIAPKIGLKVGESIKNAEPVKAAPPHTEGDTSAAPINTESNIEPSVTAPEAAPQTSEGDSLISGSVKARKLGERSRKLANTLLEDASKTDTGRANLKKLVESDPELDKYFRKHFPGKYTQALNEPSSSAPLDEATIKQSARMEMLQEQMRAEKEESSLDLAVKLKFTQAEADDLTEMALKLEGSKIGGKEIDFDEALVRAARTIRPDKARVGITQLPAGFGEGSMTPDTKVNQVHEKLADSYRSVTGQKRSKDTILKNLKTVESGYSEKARRFVMPR